MNHSAIESVPELVELIKRELGSEYMHNDNVKEVISAMKHIRLSGKKWTELGCKESDPYTRYLVDKGNDKFNLILIAWKPHSERYFVAKKPYSQS